MFVIVPCFYHKLNVYGSLDVPVPSVILTLDKRYKVGLTSNDATTYIDYKIGFKGWSFEIAIPIIIIIANVTMFVLTIVSYKRYIRYAIYQLIICVFSLLPAYFIIEKMILNPVLSYVAIGISCLNFLLTIFLCARDVKEAIKMKFHT